jgi:hypothetical protein
MEVSSQIRRGKHYFRDQLKKKCEMRLVVVHGERKLRRNLDGLC